MLHGFGHTNILGVIGEGVASLPGGVVFLPGIFCAIDPMPNAKWIVQNLSCLLCTLEHKGEAPQQKNKFL
jgi:hypothetical protein